MSRVETLDPATVPLSGIGLVEASAGTGKTWLIAALYLRLVLGHGGEHPALLPPQILVVTFTRAATAELRERIRARLTEAARVFRGERAGDEFLQQLAAGYDGDGRIGAALQLELAAQWMDEAAIFTIHGWCQRMLARHAFATGEPFALSAEVDEAELRAEACRDYWRRQCYPLPPVLFAPLHAQLSGPDALAARLAPLLARPDCVLAGADEATAGTLAAQLQPLLAAHGARMAELRQRWRELLDALEAALPALDACCSGRYWRRDWYRPWLDRLRLWVDGHCDDPELPANAWQRLSVDGMRQALKPGAELPQLDAFAETAALAAFLAQRPPLLATTLGHALPHVRRSIEQEKRRAARTGFDDMLLRLDAALGRAGALPAQLRAAFPVALIDEFQDTDPVQWRIFERIWRDGGGLLLIGDPKQAIYGFRGADIRTYFAARRRARQPTLTLARNHRATTAMVAAVNAVFEHGDARCRDGAFGYGHGEDGLAFTPVRAAGRADRCLLDERELPALTLACVDGDELLGKGDYVARAAAACADTIVDWLTRAGQGRGRIDGGDRPRPLGAADIAVLVRDRGEAEQIATALRRRGVACVYLSDGESVFASREAADLLHWLRALATPNDDRLLRAALATPSFALDHATLDRLGHDELYREDCIDRFRRGRELWRRAGVLAALRHLLHAFAIPARLSAGLRGERALTNLLHVAELLQHAAVALDGEHALVRHLADELLAAASGTPEASEQRIVRLESEDALVRIVTVHKSKGLEYPLVCLPFACRHREPGDPGWVERHEDGRRLIEFEVGDSARAEAERERRREEARLLYVALTRAQFACWVGVAVLADGRKARSASDRSALGRLIGGDVACTPAEFSAAVDALCARCPQIVRRPLTVAEPLPRYVADGTRFEPAPVAQVQAPARPRWTISSYSALARGSEADSESAAEAVFAEEAEPDSGPAPMPRLSPLAGFPGGAEAGSFLHTLLEWAAAVGFDRVGGDRAALQAELQRRCTGAGYGDAVDIVLGWLPSLLATPLGLPTAPTLALAALAPGRYRAEFEFHLEVRALPVARLDRLLRDGVLPGRRRPTLAPNRVNGLLKGFVDLVFEHQGRWWLADYKSNQLPAGYHAEALAQSILDHRYELQYTLYLLALHRFLRLRLADYDYDRHVGGAVYLYLRGIDGAGGGVFVDRPSRAVIEALDAAFADEPERLDVPA